MTKETQEEADGEHQTDVMMCEEKRFKWLPTAEMKEHISHKLNVS